MTNAAHNPPSRNPRLVLRGPGKPRVADLPTLPAIFGRGSECAIPAPGRTVGRTHMKISGSAAHLVAEDAGSSSGTFRNGQKLGGPTTVKDRDIFVCGDVQVQFFLPPPAAKDASELVLELLDPPVTGQIVNLPQTTDRTLTVGRTPKNDLTIAHKKTSGEHCVIMRRASGALVVVDQGSTNGTRINGRNIEPNVPAEIFNGDLVQFGQVIAAVRPRSYQPPVPPPAVSAADVAAAVAGPSASADESKGTAKASSSGSDSGLFQPVQSASETPAAPASPSGPAAGAPVDIPPAGASGGAGEVTVDPFGDLLNSAPNANANAPAPAAPAANQDLPVKMPWEIGHTPPDPFGNRGNGNAGDESGVQDASLVSPPGSTGDPVPPTGVSAPPEPGKKPSPPTVPASEVQLQRALSASPAAPVTQDGGAAAVLLADQTVAVPDPDVLVAARFSHAVGMGIPPVKGPALVALPESGETEPPPEQAIVARLTGPMLVGRKKGMDLRLLNGEISGLHAMLDPDQPTHGGPTNFIVRNAGALNGVFVNGVRTEAHLLRHLDQVAFGPFRYLYIGDGHKYPAPLREFPPDVQKQVRRETEGELKIRRPFLAVTFELLSVATAVILVTVLLLAWNGILPPLDECVDMVARRFRGG